CLRQIVYSVVAVERGSRHVPGPVRTHQAKPSVKGDGDRGGVRRRNRPAPRASRGDEADVAVLLRAEADGAPPVIRLVVVVAPGVQTEVAAEGPHVPERRRADGAGRKRERAV